MWMKTVSGVACAACAVVVWAQPSSPEPVKMAEFPAGATVPKAQELADRLANRVWRAQFANGQKARYDFQGQYLYVDISTRARDVGVWRTDDGMLCAEFRGRFPSGCSDARIVEGKVWFRRASTGELVSLEAD